MGIQYQRKWKAAQTDLIIEIDTESPPNDIKETQSSNQSKTDEFHTYFWKHRKSYISA